MSLTDDQLTVLFVVLCNPMETKSPIYHLVTKHIDDFTLEQHDEALEFLVDNNLIMNKKGANGWIIYAATIHGVNLCSEKPSRSRLDAILLSRTRPNRRLLACTTDSYRKVCDGRFYD